LGEAWARPRGVWAWRKGDLAGKLDFRGKFGCTDLIGGDDGTVEERSDSPSSGGARYEGIGVGGGLFDFITLVGGEGI
jgi:hypothetical protein